MTKEEILMNAMIDKARVIFPPDLVLILIALCLSRAMHSRERAEISTLDTWDCCFLWQLLYNQYR